jgi:UDP-3-O-[3-hydroxymyristoyl] glucosamine N-acyltransferase
MGRDRRTLVHTIDQIVEFLGERAIAVRGDASLQVEGFVAATPGRAGAISFITGRDQDAMVAIESSASSAFLAPPGTVGRLTCEKVVVEVSSPRLEFARVGHRFFPVSTPLSEVGVHPTASIGEGTVVGPGTLVEPHVSIGRDCVIGPNVVIRSRSVLGDRVRVGPGSVIGEYGFGFERDEGGHAIRLPHYGRVWIGDDVEIGSNVVVDRGVFTDTAIHAGVKIDSLVLIGHNVIVDEDAFVIGGAVLCGGVRAGRRAWIAPRATIMEKMTVGDDATVGIGSTVCRDVPAGATVMGPHARPALQLGG